MVINKLEKQKDNKTSTPNNKINDIQEKFKVGIMDANINANRYDGTDEDIRYF